MHHLVLQYKIFSLDFTVEVLNNIITYPVLKGTKKVRTTGDKYSWRSKRVSTLLHPSGWERVSARVGAFKKRENDTRYIRIYVVP